MRLIDRVHQPRRTERPADFPSGHAKRLTQAADRQRALSHAGQSSQPGVNRVIIKNMLVNFVRNRDHIVLYAKLAD